MSGSGLTRVVVSHEKLGSEPHMFRAHPTLSYPAVSFLLKNKFRFDLPFSEGVTYLSRKEEAQIRTSWAARYAEKGAIEDMILKTDDKPLIDHIHISVKKWLSYPLVEREDYLNIPRTTPESPRVRNIPNTLNRYQIRLTHQIIRRDYPNLKTLGRDGFVRVMVRNEREDVEEKLRQERYREQVVLRAIEFRWLIEALCGGNVSNIPEQCFLAALPSKLKPSNDEAPYRQLVENLQQKLSTRRRVLFGHNCFIDLVYLYACFIDDPPEYVEDFQELIHGLFPAVVDTKYLASFVKGLRFKSDLETLEKETRAERLPIIHVPTAYDRYVWVEEYHEAGYDSFMTAKIAIKLTAKLEREGELREPGKLQMIVKAGQTILLDAAAYTEDEEQADEYVTAPESAAEIDLVLSAHASKLSLASSDLEMVTDKISQPPDGRQLSDPDPLAQFDPDPEGKNIATVGELKQGAEREPAQGSDDSPSASGGKTRSDMSASSDPVLAAKGKMVDWRNPAKVKQIKNALGCNNLFDILDTPVGPITDHPPSPEHHPISHLVGNADEGKKVSESDLLVWSDREDQEDGEIESDGGASEGFPGPAEKLDVPLSAQQLEDKINRMARKGEMMPRWDGESGIWKVIGNKLVVNASEEGICIL